MNVAKVATVAAASALAPNLLFFTWPAPCSISMPEGPEDRPEPI
jgi:hypothetical protein